VRRRLFADFALAHTLQFQSEVCSGQVRLNTACLPRDGEGGPSVCKGRVVRSLREDRAHPRVTEVWAVGDNLNDLGLLRAADRAFVIDPKSPRLLAALPDAVRIDGFEELLAQVPDPVAETGMAAAP
jgi:glucosyl-3-phosphoglycerate synthase